MRVFPQWVPELIETDDSKSALTLLKHKIPRGFSQWVIFVSMLLSWVVPAMGASVLVSISYVRHKMRVQQSTQIVSKEYGIHAAGNLVFCICW